jgi:hypothetical protein
MGVSDERHGPAILAPGKTSRTYGTVGWVGPRACLDNCGEEKNALAPPGLKPRAGQLVASCCTDYGIPAPSIFQWILKTEWNCVAWMHLAEDRNK